MSADTSHVARNTALILLGSPCRGRGGGEFVNKPIDREGLVLRVRNLLRTREAFEQARMRHAPAS